MFRGWQHIPVQLRAPRSALRLILFLACWILVGVVLWLVRIAPMNTASRLLGSLVVVADRGGTQRLIAPYHGQLEPPDTRLVANIDMGVSFGPDVNINPVAARPRWMRAYVVDYGVSVQKYSQPYRIELEPVQVQIADADALGNYADLDRDSMLQRIAADMAMGRATLVPQASGFGGMAPPTVYSGTIILWDSIVLLGMRVFWWVVLAAAVGLAAYRLLIAFTRRRAGKCVSCGYDHSGLVGAVCPECGVARASLPTARR